MDSIQSFAPVVWVQLQTLNTLHSRANSYIKIVSTATIVKPNLMQRTFTNKKDR